MLKIDNFYLLDSEKSIFTLRNFAYLLIVLIAFTIMFKDVLASYPFFLYKIKIRGIDDLFNLALWTMMFIDLIYRRIPRIIVFVLLVISYLAFYSIFQAVILERNILVNNFILLIRDNLWFIPAYYFIVSTPAYYFRKLIFIGNIFITIQILAVILQIVFTLIVKHELLFEDDVNGTLGQNTSHIMSYTLIMFCPLIYIQKRYFVLAVCIIIILLTSARSSYFICFISFIIIYTLNKNILKNMPKIIIGLILFSLLFYLYNRLTNSQLDTTNLYNQQTRPLEKYSGANRISFALYTIDRLIKEEKILYGFGIGSYASRTAINLKAERINELQRDFMWAEQFINGGSTYNVWLGEYGIIGTMLLIILNIVLLVSIRKNRFFCAVMLTVFLGLIPQKLMESYAVGFFYWYLFGIYSLYIKNEKSIHLSTSPQEYAK